ncbi:MAG TPA: hypothetical protein VG651_18025 [Stellaceae bacterium]|nr:hypothetical protein [Stellaceae bacterium]
MKADRARQTVAGNASGSARTGKPAEIPPAVAGEIIPVAARLVRLPAGLAVVEVAGRATPGKGKGVPLWVGALPTGPGQRADLLAAAGAGEQWLRPEGDVVVVRAPRAGELLLASAFGAPGLPPDLAVRAIAGRSPGPEPVAASAPPSVTRPERDIRAEVTVHIEGSGDRVFPGASWAGKPGDHKRVEGFSIKPLQELRPNEIEYKALHPGGVETPWVAGPQFCGTRGRSLPIVGVAVRIAPHVQDQFSVVYQAAFFRSGVTESRSNGAPCLPKAPGDPLEAINIRILQSQPG